MEEYAHTTSLGNLKAILESGGKLRTLRRIAESNPDSSVRVEPLPMQIKFNLPAGLAARVMRVTKDLDHVFLTRDGYLKNYGDVVVLKRLGNSVTRRRHLNLIPNEYTTPRDVSLRNAAIYVPDDKVDELSGKYPKHRILPKSELELKAFTKSDRVKSLLKNISNVVGLDKEAEELDVEKMFGRRARLVGSQALGTALPGKSDMDVFVPLDTEKAFAAALLRMQKKHPEYTLSKTTESRTDKKIFHGEHEGAPVDVAFAYGPKAKQFAEAFERAAASLTDDERKEILAEKQRLKNALFFPGTRYRNYKKQIDRRLGLDEAYF